MALVMLVTLCDAIMRTTRTLDEDVTAIIGSERRRTGESFRTTVNRLIRCGAAVDMSRLAPSLPEQPGGPILEITDASAVLADLDERRRLQRQLP